jgi:hypothetical protein
MSLPKKTAIVGIALVRNEDVFIERVLRNAIDFCDRLVVADHQSSDGTSAILTRLAGEFADRLQLVRIQDPRESHFLINKYAGSSTWVFAVDGDEIYDPAGLVHLRAELLAGKYDESWLVFGNVLNCTAIDETAGTATGHLAPPCRSMTKLFNFRIIESWDGAATHVCANGTIKFKPGYDASRRLHLHEQIPWEEAQFRCLHTCFMRRSSLDPAAAPARPNVSETYLRGGMMGRSRKFLDWLRGRPAVSDWKLEKYARGELVTVDARPFLRPT